MIETGETLDVKINVDDEQIEQLRDELEEVAELSEDIDVPTEIGTGSESQPALREKIQRLGDVEIEFGVFEEGIELYAMKGNGGTIHHHRFVSETPSGERVGEELHRANAAARGYEQAIEDVLDIMEDEG